MLSCKVLLLDNVDMGHAGRVCYEFLLLGVYIAKSLLDVCTKLGETVHRQVGVALLPNSSLPVCDRHQQLHPNFSMHGHWSLSLPEYQLSCLYLKSTYVGYEGNSSILESSIAMKKTS